MKRFASAHLVLLLGLQPMTSHGQASSSGESRDGEQVAEIAVIALGPRPQRRFREVNGVEGSVMLLAQPGETPPSRLFYQEPGSRGADRRWSTFNLAFNNPSTFRKIRPGVQVALHRRNQGDSDEYEAYVSLPAVAPASRSIFFLTPQKLGPTPWDDPPAIRQLNLESTELTDKQFLLANFSQHQVEHAFGNTVEVVKPNQLLTYQREEVGEIYRLAARYGAEQKIIYNTAVRLNDEGHAQLFVLYDANPATNAGRDVGVFRMMIPARKNEMEVEKESNE